MCGSFREKKGFPIGVRAFARVAGRHPGARLHIIGDGPQRPQIEAAVREGNLESRVDFLGMLDADQYRRRLTEAHVLLHPSITARDGDTEEFARLYNGLFVPLVNLLPRALVRPLGYYMIVQGRKPNRR